MERGNDGGETFDVTVLEAERPSRTVLFAVGAGGNPERHLPLLTSLAERGCTVVAPHFARIVSPAPSDDELLLRARRSRIAVESFARPDVPIAGVGHSIGTTSLLGLAGGAIWMREGHRLTIERLPRMDRLALLAPATGFFRAPGALDGVDSSLLVLAGSVDTVTPPAQAELLKLALGARVPVDLRVLAGAGHFSFMHVLPPHVTDPLPDREAFLAELVSEVERFVRR